MFHHQNKLFNQILIDFMPSLYAGITNVGYFPKKKENKTVASDQTCTYVYIYIYKTVINGMNLCKFGLEALLSRREQN